MARTAAHRGEPTMLAALSHFQWDARRGSAFVAGADGTAVPDGFETKRERHHRPVPPHRSARPLFAASGYRRWPPRLPEQPIF